MRILAVDDDPVILQILRASIESFNTHEIEFANSGDEALEKIASSPNLYDCFLFDIQMPGMTGIELCKLVRAKPDYAETPIIMVTAMMAKNYVDDSFIAGATDYVTKPFDLIELKARMNGAEKLSAAVASARQAETNTAAPVAAPSGSGVDYKVSDVIPILDVNGVITTSTFKNYLGQMKRGQFSRVVFLALKVLNIETIYSHASSGGEFEEVVLDLAEAVSDVFRPMGGIITYLGNGVFCCVVDSKTQIPFDELPARLEDAVYSLDLLYANGAPVAVEFVVGAPVSSGFFSKADASELIQKAIRNLEEQVSQSNIMGQVF